MSRTSELFLSLGADVLIFLVVVLNAIVVFALGWSVFHMLRDHWSAREVWTQARRRLGV